MKLVLFYFIALLSGGGCYPLLTMITNDAEATSALKLFSKMPLYVPYVAVDANYRLSDEVLRKLHGFQARITYSSLSNSRFTPHILSTALSTWLPILLTLPTQHVLIAPPTSSLTSQPPHDQHYVIDNNPALLCFSNTSTSPLPHPLISFIASYAGLHTSIAGYLKKNSLSCSEDVLVLRMSSIPLLLTEVQRLSSNLQHYHHLYATSSHWREYNVELYLFESALISLQLPFHFLQLITYILSDNGLPVTLAQSPDANILPEIAHVIDFIEIGTSDVGSCIEGMSLQMSGVSVEPVAEQLNTLPNKTNVLKLPYALAGNTNETTLQFSYLSYDIIERYALPRVLLQQGHLHATEQLPFNDILTKYDLPASAVTTIPVPLITFEEIFRRYFDISDALIPATYLRLLKIDAEGYDFRILESFLEFSSVHPHISPPCTLFFEVLGVSHDILLPWIESNLLPYSYDVHVRHADAIATHPSCTQQDYEVISPLLGPLWCGYDMERAEWSCGSKYISGVLRHNQAPLYF